MSRDSANDRYQRTVAALDDFAQVASLARAIRATASTGRPTGVMLVLWKHAVVQRVGVLSGSFNPLTRAHAALAGAARRAGALDAIIWALPIASIGKERTMRASLADRATQMRVFAEGVGDALVVVNRGLYVEQAEIVQSLIAARVELVFITGFDRLLAILDPRYYDDRDVALDQLFARASLLVAPRDEHTEADLSALLNQTENQRYQARISYCPLSQRFRRDASSAARALAASGAGQQLEALLTPEGLALARTPGVYAQDFEDSEPEGMNHSDAYQKRLLTIEQLSGTGAASPGPENWTNQPDSR